MDTNVRQETVPGADGATFARIHAIPCLAQISPDKMDRDLMNKLREEATRDPLAWAVEGARSYIEHGLPRPEKVSVATNSWRGECDFLDQFLPAKCVTGEYCRAEGSGAVRRRLPGVGRGGRRAAAHWHRLRTADQRAVRERS